MNLPRRIPKHAKRSSRWRSAAALQEILRHEDGLLIWQERPREMFADQRSFRSWNARFAGKAAFTAINNCGYRVGNILGQSHLAHRIIWELVTGKAPEGEIDHIDGNRANNLPSNLRLVSRAENRRNVKRSSNNTSGATGVVRVGKLWQAQIQIDGVTTRLGRFAAFTDAVEIRKLAEQENGFHPNHGRA